MSTVALRNIQLGLPEWMWLRPTLRQSPLSLPDVSRPSANAATTKDAAGTATQAWYPPFLEALEEASNLPQGWGGPGSQPPPIAMLFAATQVMATIAKPSTRAPALVPLLDGRVQLVWYAAGIELEIIIDGDGSAKASLFDLATQTEVDDLLLTDWRIADAIEKLS